MEEMHTVKRKLEDSYCVKITDVAFDLAVQGLSTFDSKLISDDASAMKILDEACKLVLERFRNCAYESSFYDEAYQLRCALVEIIEECRKYKLGPDDDPGARSSWIDLMKWKRDCASIFMIDFLGRWENVVTSSCGTCKMTRECVYKLKDINKTSSCCLDDVSRFLKDNRDDLIYSFSPFLTVDRAHVAEVLSNLSDVPPSQFHQQKWEAINKMNTRVLEQEHVIRDIYETLASSSTSINSTRPRGLFLLLGQSGAGKTEIAKAVAEHWYCDASRLVEIDMSEINGDESVLWRRLSEIVAKRPYSVIVLDKIEKASSTVTRVLLEVLSKPPSDLDLSFSIIFMTSSVGSDHLGLFCKCHQRDEEESRKQFLLDNLKLFDTHNCILKGSGSERALAEAKKYFSADLLDSVDKVLAVKSFRNYQAVLRLLLREVVRQQFTGQRLVVHASEDALVFLFDKNKTQFVEGGKALKRLLVEQVIPRLPPAGQDLKNVVVYIEKLGRTSELSFSVHRHEQSADDWYFKLKDGTFNRLMANLRTKVESVGRIFKLTSDYLAADSNPSDHELLADNIFNEILQWSPFQETPHDIYGDAKLNAPSSWGNRKRIDGLNNHLFVVDQCSKKRPPGGAFYHPGAYDLRKAAQKIGHLAAWAALQAPIFCVLFLFLFFLFFLFFVFCFVFFSFYVFYVYL